MGQTDEENNKETVLKAIDTLFNKRDYLTAEHFWSPKYIQHSAHIPPGREGLFEFVKNAPITVRYENQLIVANGDYVMFHGRYSGLGSGMPAWVVVDIVRLQDGIIAEHWDVIEDEATKQQSKSGRPMFGDRFPSAA